jgi:dTDP-4-amino-4,6-dideoxygalactose transaminase
MSDRIPLLDLTRDYGAIRAELEAAWGAALRDMQLLRGREVAAFEAEIAAYLGTAHARAVASGTDALRLVLTAIGVGPGHRVILPANAFVAALEAVHARAAVPVLVDVENDGFAPDPDAIAAALPATAVLVVHLYGGALPLAPLVTRCEQHGTLLVEDASHAHGARRAGRAAGTFGIAGCFSAGVVKNLGAYGDAGFVTTNDPHLAETITLLRHHGQARKNEHVWYGGNSRLDELQAVVLRVKLRHLERRNARRRAIAAFYHERFAPLGIRVPLPDADEVPVYHQYVIRTPVRDQLQAHLAARGIETGVHYPVPLHRQPAWLRVYGESPPLPRAERLAREILSLPVFPDLTDAEVERVAAAVTSFFG